MAHCASTAASPAPTHTLGNQSGVLICRGQGFSAHCEALHLQAAPAGDHPTWWVWSLRVQAGAAATSRILRLSGFEPLPPRHDARANRLSSFYSPLQDQGGRIAFEGSLDAAERLFNALEWAMRACPKAAELSIDYGDHADDALEAHLLSWPAAGSAVVMLADATLYRSRREACDLLLAAAQRLIPEAIAGMRTRLDFHSNPWPVDFCMDQSAGLFSPDRLVAMHDGDPTLQKKFQAWARQGGASGPSGYGALFRALESREFDACLGHPLSRPQPPL
jgi:hypothetical protein